ncbi:Glycine/D-amino acid oxidase [Pseudomonas sp. UC 17F4]|uniref:NAD(P)/FAD-dependent oxidoreductase n=1 Tax=Pseudomonas sp. UC 17F4 TaxID=1855328 RepID=UPI000882AB28|nr:FAD-dependent oxidoreductase [Pseudomonas sp. UC 17F4]SDQ61536.1 Glycine/D-amino acid oxidase [Pseudomonas sp. UC 17F4]
MTAEAERPHVVVIGAGIVGASIAYHLSKHTQVTVIDKGQPGLGVTSRAFGWINTTAPQPGEFAALRNLAIGEYHRLQDELGAAPINWSGALSFSAAPSPAAGVEPIDPARVRKLEPQFKAPLQQALFAPQEGSIDPLAMTRLLLERAQANGARVLSDTQVLAIECRDGAVAALVSAEGRISCERLVVAAGTACKALLQPLGISLPLHPSPSILIRLRAQRRLVHTLIASSELEIRQPTPELILAAEDYLDADGEDGPQGIAQRARNTIRNSLHGGQGLELISTEVGLRPMPDDRIPIIGALPTVSGLYLAVMHSGVTLAAVVGRLVAQELIDSRLAPELQGCRPSRFSL